MASVNIINDTQLTWAEFCNKHAKTAAAEFVKALCNYIRPELNANEVSRLAVSHKEFLKKFVDCFMEHFESEFSKNNTFKEKLTNGSILTPGTSPGTNRINNHEEFSDYSERDADSPSPKASHKPFFRRLSFKGLKKGKSLFTKQSSDEVDGMSSHHGEKHSKHSKTKLAKIVVECRKEGIVNYLIGENPDGTEKWEKCRLALVKTVGGYMLEFYSPPKATKPKSGVFCFLISEARETTALEMPDHENTFVLKDDHGVEYVIEAHDSDDMRSWLATVKYCMRSSPPADIPENSPLSEVSERLRMPSGMMVNNNCIMKPSAPGMEPVNGEHPPELPPRVPGPSIPGQRLSFNSSFDLCSSRTDIESMAEGECDYAVTLREYPWFHGTLPRSDAATLVLHGGAAAHGVFLVRQSETRKGEFVLTFNFQGRAKHLRMTLNDQFQCKVQHLWFPTIFDMLEHFRQHPIPLESGGTADVTLTDYVVHLPLAGSSMSQSASTHNNVASAGGVLRPHNPSTSTELSRRPPPTPETQEVIIHSGLIRQRIQSLEFLQNIAAYNSSSSAGSHSNPQSSSTGARAVENMYSFV
nr:PREDICTED: SH2B adapter protein 2 [Bemisia tabaci]